MKAGKATAEETAEVLGSIHAESGANLLALAESSPVLLVFLRHFGCPFCRRTIEQIAELRGEFEARGVRVVFVHLGTPEIATAHFDYYGLSDVERVHDPGAAIYRHPVFALSRTNPYLQFVNPVVWVGWVFGGGAKHGLHKIEGDGRQMPGIFFLKDAKILRRFVHRTIADQPDYLQLMR